MNSSKLSLSSLMGHFEIPLHNKTRKFSSRLYWKSRQNTYFFSPLHTTPVHCLLTAPAMDRFTSSAALPLPAFRAASASAQGANLMGRPGIQLSDKQQAMIKCRVCAFCIMYVVISHLLTITLQRKPYAHSPDAKRDHSGSKKTWFMSHTASQQLGWLEPRSSLTSKSWTVSRHLLPSSGTSALDPFL